MKNSYCNFIFRKKSTTTITSNATSIPYLYISANVANMPEETALTPLVADFFQQLLENLPQHIPQQVNLFDHYEFIIQFCNYS